jgi:uncharacterized protein
VLITGASGGIGLELAHCFAQGGYNLVLAARSGEALDNAAANLAGSFQVNVVPVPFDLGRPDAGTQLAQTLGERALNIDVVVNNAGYGTTGSFDKSDLSAQLGMIDLNVRAVVELTHLFWPRMLNNKRGGVLNLASTGAFQPGPFMAVYCATKAFILSFTEALWEEARGTGVKVSCLCPGSTESAFHKRAGSENLPLHRAGLMSAGRVARLGYSAFQSNTRVKVTGAGNAFMAHSVAFVPRSLMLQVARQMLRPR